MTYGNHRGIHEADTVTFAKSNQLHKQHKMDEHTRHEFNESVIRDGCRKISGEMPFYIKYIVVLEVGKRAEMITYDDGHNLAF